MASSQTMGPREWAMLIVLSILWGGSFFFVGVVVKVLPPFTIVFLRVGLAALALLIWLRIIGMRIPTDRRVWAAFFGMGLLNNFIPFCLIVWGQTQIGSGLASILNATTPLFGVVVAHMLTSDEKMTPNRVAGVILGLAGVVVMIGPDVLGGASHNMLAQLAVLGAALSYAFAGVFGRRFKAMGVDPVATATGQVSATTIMLAPLVLIVEQPWHLAAPSGQSWAAILGLALLSTALAYVLFFRILAAAGATNLLLVTFLIPVSAILLGVAVLGEHLSAGEAAGMALIASGLVAIDGRLVARFRPRHG